SDESPIDEDEIQPLSSAETELPPEARGEANGGPLGCCLGLTVGLMLSLFLSLIGFGHVAALGLVALTHAALITNIRIATGIFAVVGAFAGGYAGWKLGKRKCVERARLVHARSMCSIVMEPGEHTVSRAVCPNV